MLQQKVKTTVAQIVFSSLLATGAGVSNAQEPIIHDAEYYILEAQHAEKWDADNKTVDKKLAEFTKKNGGKPPNILYILIDDIGFGDLGIPELNAIRGYKTPNINKISDESMRFRECTRNPVVLQHVLLS